MSKKTLNKMAVPDFYRKLGTYAVDEYRRRKTEGKSTRHFTVNYGNVKYVFWCTGYDPADRPFQIRPVVDVHIRHLKTLSKAHHLKKAPVSSRLSYLSINKPGR